MKIRYNEDTSIVDEVRQAVESNGGYCPCKLDKTPDTKCMCQEFIDFVKSGQAGLCHCGLYESYDS